MITITHFTKRDLCDVKHSLATQNPIDRIVHTPDGYERIRTLRAPVTKPRCRSEHNWNGVDMILQYWHSAGNVEWFKNYTSFEEWEHDNK